MNWYKKSQIETEQLEETKTTPSNDWTKQEETNYKDPLSHRVRDVLEYLIKYHSNETMYLKDIYNELESRLIGLDLLLQNRQNRSPRSMFGNQSFPYILGILIKNGYLKRIYEDTPNREDDFIVRLTDKGLYD